MDGLLRSVGMSGRLLTTNDFLHPWSLPNITYAMDRLMFPPIEQGKVRDRSRIIVAAKEAGKSTFARAQAQKAYSTYGDDVNVIATYSIKLAMERMNNRPVQYIIVDDAMSEQNSNDIKAVKIGTEFMRIRHIYEDRNKTDTGVVITDFLTQRWIGIHPMFRSNAHCFIFKSILTNPKDNNDIRTFVGPRAYAELEDISRRIYEERDDSAKGECIGHLPFSDRSGYYSFSYPSLKLKFLDPNAQDDDLISDLVFGTTHEMFLYDRRDAVLKMMQRGKWKDEAKVYYLLNYEPSKYPTQASVAKKLGVDQSRISQMVNAFRAQLSTIAGEEYERYVAMRYEKDGYKIERRGGPGEPDIITTDPAGNRPLVIACKCLDLPKSKKYSIEEFRPEIRYAREAGADRIVVEFYNLSNRLERQLELRLDGLPVHVTLGGATDP